MEDIGRIMKKLFKILKTELGISIKNIKYSIIGIFNHFYKNNVYGVNINTHYFVCAINIILKKNFYFKNDKQHSKFILLTKKQAMAHKKVHKYSKIYLRKVK